MRIVTNQSVHELLQYELLCTISLAIMLAGFFIWEQTR
jgi:hypothetical protein